MTNVGNGAIGQFQSIAQLPGGRLVGIACAMQSREQPISAAIASEHAAGAIGPVSTGCQADNQQVGSRRPQVGDRLTPIIEIAKGFSFRGRDSAAVFNQSRAASANFDRFIELIPGQPSSRSIRVQQSSLF